jgi:hypothetical protein
MSGSGLWFSRFTAGGEGWLPLVAFGSSAWMFVAAGSTPDVADAPVVSTAQAANDASREPLAQRPAPLQAREGSIDARDGERSGLDAPARGHASASLR